MSNGYSRLQSANQQAFLKTSQALGVIIQFSHRGAALVSLYARVNEEDSEVDESGGHVDEGRGTIFEVSTLQAGFTTPVGEIDPVTAGDTIVYNGASLSVDRWKANRYRGTYQMWADDPTRVRTGVE
jgi:hypothetical protein